MDGPISREPKKLRHILVISLIFTADTESVSNQSLSLLQDLVHSRQSCLKDRRVSE